MSREYVDRGPYLCRYEARHGWVVYLNDAGDLKYLCETNAEAKAKDIVGIMNAGVARFDAKMRVSAPATAVEEARGAVSSLAFARRVLVATLLDHDEIVCGDWRIECELDPANLTERFAFSTPKGETMYDTAEEAVDALLAAEAADEGHTLAAKESRSDDRPAAASGDSEGGDDGR